MLRVENFAERLFCDLRNAGVKIEAPEYVQEGAKIGHISRYGDMAQQQLKIIGANDKYQFGYGPGIEDSEFVSFVEAYQRMLSAIVEMKHIRFYSLVIPRCCVVEVKLEEFADKVVSRYIQDYLQMSDQIIERYDILIGKVNANV